VLVMVMMCDDANAMLLHVYRADSVAWSPHELMGAILQCSAILVRHEVTDCRTQWRRQGERRGRGEASPPYGWTSRNYVIGVCFHCHGTSSYHTTNTLQGRRARLIHRQYNRDWGTSYSRPPIDPYLTSPPVTKSWRRHWS